MKKMIIFKYVFAITFFILGIIRLFWSNYFNIDYITIVIFVIAYIPWIAYYLKSIKIFGTEIEFYTEQKAKRIDEASINLNIKIDSKIKNDDIIHNKTINEEILGLEDDIMKLVHIRVNLEKELKIMCEKNRIKIEKLSLPFIAKKLREEKLLDNETCNLILDIIPMLNSAVHYDNRINNYSNSILYTIDAGINIVNYLRKININ